MNLRSRIRSYFPILVLVAIELVLFVVNYAPGTYFLGWDNLFPELNFAENLKRSIFSVWQEYRGLGIVDSMSFAANLPYYLWLLVASFVVPQELLRYFSFFFLHFLGGLGMYFLLRELFKTNLNKTVIALLGALFYLFNLATVQMFYAPYELFALHFAFLPFLILFTLQFLKFGSKKSLILFSLFSFFSIPQAHVPTIFIVYLVALVSVLLFHVLREKKAGIKRVFVIILLTILINSYWGLPFAYSALTNAGVVVNSKVNQMSTEDDFLRNKARGDLKSVALLEGFWLDYTDSQPKGNNDFIMTPWRQHTDGIFFQISGFLFFVLALTGAFIALRKKNTIFYPFVFLFAFSFLMLGSDIPILGSVSALFNNFVPFFSNLFRFTFTKFSILYAFSFSILLALFLSLILEKLRLKHSSLLLPLIFSIVLFYNSFPSFRGNFLYYNLKVKIPHEYFQLTEYLKTKEDGRIATLPSPSYWGWTYTNWGYRGSGFIWYGIPQPTMDGAFFPWSKEIENYYWEISYAINSSNQKYFDSVLKKYNISQVLLDRYIVSQYSSKATSIENLENLLKNSQLLSPEIRFGKIELYDVKDQNEKNYVSLFSNLPKINAYNWNNLDIAYLENTDYTSTRENNEQIFYPLRSLFTGRTQKDLEFGILDKGHYFSLTTKVPTSLAGRSLVVPKAYKEEVTEANAELLEVLKYPQFLLDNELILANIQETENLAILSEQSTEIKLPYIKKGDLEIRVPKIEGFYSYKSEGSDLSKRPFKNCNPFTKGEIKNEEIRTGAMTVLRLTSLNSNNCFSFDLPTSSQRLGFLVKVKARNIEGKTLLFAVINKNSQKPELETRLPKNEKFSDSFFIIPPMEDFGAGYNLYFDNASIGRQKSINELAEVEVHPIPYRFLTGVKIEKNPSKSVNLSSNIIEVTHPNPSHYEIKFKDLVKPNTTLVLSQSYNPGWLAIGKGVGDHIIVNNWANGWDLNSEEMKTSENSIYIVYLPQYLEYLGFLLLLGVPIYLFRLRL